MSHKSVPRECPTRLSYKSVLQECPARVSYKSVAQVATVSVIQGVPQECTRVSHKGFRNECVLQECPAKVSPTRVFEYVFAFGFVGSILLECKHVSCLEVFSPSNPYRSHANCLHLSPLSKTTKTEEQIDKTGCGRGLRRWMLERGFWSSHESMATSADFAAVPGTAPNGGGWETEVTRGVRIGPKTKYFPVFRYPSVVTMVLVMQVTFGARHPQHNLKKGCQSDMILKNVR